MSVIILINCSRRPTIRYKVITIIKYLKNEWWATEEKSYDDEDALGNSKVRDCVYVSLGHEASYYSVLGH